MRNVEIDDAENGTYAVTYTGQDAGDYLIECEFLGTFGGEKGHVRGSPCTALLDEMAPRANNAINGKLLATRLRDDIDFLLDFTKRTLDIITAQTTSVDWPPERQVNAIAAIKGGIDLIGEREAEVALSLDRVDATLTYLKGMGKNVNAQMAQLGSAREKWEDLKQERPRVEMRIKPLLKSQGAKIRQDITEYEAFMHICLDQVQQSVWKLWETGYATALVAMDASIEAQAKEQRRCDDMVKLANIFDCPEEMQASMLVMGKVDDILADFQTLWKCAQDNEFHLEGAREVYWAELNCDGLEEVARSLTSKTKKLPKSVKQSDAFKGLDKYVKNGLLALLLRLPRYYSCDYFCY